MRDNIDALKTSPAFMQLKEDYMADAELAFAPASRLMEMMDGGEVSSVELTEMFLGRIDEFNPPPQRLPHRFH